MLNQTANEFLTPSAGIENSTADFDFSVQASSQSSTVQMRTCHVIWAIQRLAERLYRTGTYSGIVGTLKVQVAGVPQLVEIGTLRLQRHIDNIGSPVAHSDMNSTISPLAAISTSRLLMERASGPETTFHMEDIPIKQIAISDKDMSYTLIRLTATVVQQNLYSKSYSYHDSDTGLNFYYRKTARRSIIILPLQMRSTIANVVEEQQRHYHTVKKWLILDRGNARFGTVEFSYAGAVEQDG